jgi:hypothetical protein
VQQRVHIALVEQLARHRPESNNIAERFVRTLKEWLETNVVARFAGRQQPADLPWRF